MLCPTRPVVGTTEKAGAVTATDQPTPAIVRQRDIQDLDGTPRRCWYFAWKGQRYSLAEAAGEPSMLVDEGSLGWGYVHEDQRDQVLEAFRAEWRAGNLDCTPRE